MFEGQCYCGRIQFTVTTEPAQLVDCNCTLCRRLGALWAHVPVASVRIDTSNAANVSYAQGDRTLAVQSCSHCGCTCLLYTSPSPRDATLSRMPSSA